MTIDARDMGLFEPLYTFVSDEGENINIASARLRAWTNDKANGIETVLVPCRHEVAEKFLAEGSVSVEHCVQLARQVCDEGLKLWPVLLALYGNVPIEEDLTQDVICVDGHHTTLLFAMSGAKEMPVQFITRAQWEPFRVIGLRDISQSTLRAMPVMKVVR